MLESIKKWGWFAVETVFVFPRSFVNSLRFEYLQAVERWKALTGVYAKEYEREFGPKQMLCNHNWLELESSPVERCTKCGVERVIGTVTRGGRFGARNA